MLYFIIFFEISPQDTVAPLATSEPLPAPKGPSGGGGMAGVCSSSSSPSLEIQQILRHDNQGEKLR